MAAQRRCHDHHAHPCHGERSRTISLDWAEQHSAMLPQLTLSLCQVAASQWYIIFSGTEHAERRNYNGETNSPEPGGGADLPQ